MFNSSPISILNHDCLFELFTYFDVKELALLAKVCRKFDAIVHKIFCVRYKRGIVLPVKSEYVVNIGTTVAVLQQFGHDVVNLEISFPVYPDLEFDLDVYADLRLNIIEEISNSVGDSLQKLCLENLQVFDLNLRTINQLKSILSHLKVLKISTFDREATPCYLDIRTLCPIIEKLKLAGDFILDAYECDRLRNFTIHRNRLLDSDTNEEMLRAFYAKNRNLSKIKIKIMDYNNALGDLYTANLDVIEKLSVECYNLSSNNFGILLRMTNLTNLSLVGIYSMDNLEETFSILCQLVKLKKLKLVMTRRYTPNINDDCLIQIAEAMRQLEYFHIAMVKLTDDGLIKFIEKALQLREINLLNTNARIDEELYQKISDIRRQFCAREILKLRIRYSSGAEFKWRGVTSMQNN